MFKINWAKIDKFYVVTTFVIVGLVALVVFSIKSIFSSIITAYEVETSLVNEQRVNKERLDEAYDFVFGKTQAATQEGIIKTE